MKFNKPAAVLCLAMSLGISAAHASVMLVDRGLPTVNLNNVAGSDRSNVAWTDGGNPPVLYGDTFKNNSTATWAISSIRMWTVRDTGTVNLWGGLTSGGAAGIASLAAGSVGGATSYADGTTQYQRLNGEFAELHAIEFAVNILLGAGEEYSFFLDGTGGPAGIPFLHASNAALSGSPQMGADGMLLEATLSGGTVTSVASWTSAGNGWDKASDFNVQVFGEAVPEPASYALVGIALAGLLVTRSRKS